MPRTINASRVQKRRLIDDSEGISVSNIVEGKRQRRSTNPYWDQVGEVQACTREGIQARDFVDACNDSLSIDSSIESQGSEDVEVVTQRQHLLRLQTLAAEDDARFFEVSGAEDEFAPAPIPVIPVYEDDAAFYSSQELVKADEDPKQDDDDDPPKQGPVELDDQTAAMRAFAASEEEAGANLLDKTL